MFRQLPRGNPSPPLFSTVRQGRCQLCDTVPPIPERLTCRALKGGAGGTLEYLLRAYTGPRRDIRPAGSVIPVAVNSVRPSPPLPHHTGHCGDIPTLLGRTGTRHDHDGHCATYGPRQRHPRTGPPRRPVNQPLHRHPRSRSCASTRRTTTPQRERDSPGRPSTPQYCSSYLHT
jgi:hypothetical protein